MFKRILFVIVIAALALAAMPLNVGAQEGDGPARVGFRPDAPEYALHGPYWVGTMELVIEDEERPLPVTVWYPALNPDGNEESYVYDFELSSQRVPVSVEGHALGDAERDAGKAPYPLVVYSHGNYGYRQNSIFFDEHLASYGFVVIALDHTGNTSVNFGIATSYAFHIHRPRDISRVIDFAEELTAEGGTLEGLIDIDHVAVTGWSFGGTTSLAMGSAQMDMEAFRAWCEDNRATYDLLGSCGQVLGNRSRLASLLGLDEVPDGLWPSMADDRVDAIVPFATDGRIFGTAGVAAVNIPVLLMVEAKSIFFPIEPVEPIFASLGSEKKSLVVFDDANHFIFANACDAVPQAMDIDMFPGCSDPVWDMDRAHDLINHFTTAFLLAVLYGDEDAAAALSPDAVSFPGITYETTGF